MPFSCKWKVHFELTAAAAVALGSALHQPKASPATPASAPPSGSTFYLYLLLFSPLFCILKVLLHSFLLLHPKPCAWDEINLWPKIGFSNKKSRKADNEFSDEFKTQFLSWRWKILCLSISRIGCKVADPPTSATRKLKSRKQQPQKQKHCSISY